MFLQAISLSLRLFLRGVILSDRPETWPQCGPGTFVPVVDSPSAIKAFLGNESLSWISLCWWRCSLAFSRWHLVPLVVEHQGRGECPSLPAPGPTPRFPCVGCSPAQRGSAERAFARTHGLVRKPALADSHRAEGFGLSPLA